MSKKLGCKPVIEWEDVCQLEYTGWVFKETLRIWPAVAAVHRITTEDLILNDMFIPKNTEISVKQKFTLFIFII